MPYIENKSTPDLGPDQSRGFGTVDQNDFQSVKGGFRYQRHISSITFFMIIRPIFFRDKVKSGEKFPMLQC